MRIHIWIVLLSLVMLSCKKEALDTEISSHFIGDWRWAYTDRYGGFSKDTYDEETSGSFRMEILEKGIIKTYKNGERTHRYRVEFLEEHDNSNTGLILHLGLNPALEEPRLVLVFYNDGTSDILRTPTDPIFFDLDLDDGLYSSPYYQTFFVRNE